MIRKFVLVSKIKFSTYYLKCCYSSIINSVTFKCPNEESTVRIGTALSRLTDIGDVFFLSGPLGSGKTRFAMGLIRGLTQEPDLLVSSPSYLLDVTYPVLYNKSAEQIEKEVLIHHIDLYRLQPKVF